jgi:hypothetical protein
MTYHYSHFKALFVVLLLALLSLGVWTISAQEGDILPLPGASAQAGEPSTINPANLLPGGLLNELSSASTGFSDLRGASRLFTQTQQITPPVIAGNQAFGIDLARHGDVMVVGAPYRNSETGAAIVYQKNTSGSWVSPVILTASDGAAGDQFGTNVAMYDDTIFVGAPYHNSNTGAVYVFRRDAGGNWVQTQKLQPVLPPSASFGAMIKVDPSGTQIIIGVNAEGVGAFVYRLESGVWQYETNLVVAGATVGLHIEGDRALVSSFAPTIKGSVVVFEKSAGAWTQTSSFTATDGYLDDRFGGRITTMDGQFFVLGDLANAGAVYVFEEVGGVWTQRQKLTASDGSTDDGFGISISPEGDTLAIGSALDETGLGSVYIFKWNGTAWVQNDKIAAVGGYFGIDAILMDGELLVGAPLSDTEVGKVYSYTDPDLVSEELLVDGGFEANAAGWTVKNETGDKVKCNKTGKTFSYEGNCAWRFKGVVGENAKIQQVITTGVDAGDTLTLSGFVNASGTINGSVKVTVSYSDGVTPKNKLKVEVTSVTGGYVPLSTLQPVLSTVVAAAPVEKVKVSLKNQGESGKVYYDALSLIAS